MKESEEVLREGRPVCRERLFLQQYKKQNLSAAMKQEFRNWVSPVIDQQKQFLGRVLETKQWFQPQGVTVVLHSCSKTLDENVFC